ncbi:putative cytochrome 71A4-like, partial [Capsicum annuum]
MIELLRHPSAMKKLQNRVRELVQRKAEVTEDDLGYIDPLSWDDPDEYRPERFLNSDIDFRGLNIELILFRGGRRGCPGITFAIMANELALAKLVHKFNFASPEGIKKDNLDITESTGITIRRKLPLLAVATPCSS